MTLIEIEPRATGIKGDGDDDDDSSGGGYPAAFSPTTHSVNTRRFDAPSILPPLLLPTNPQRRMITHLPQHFKHLT